MIHRLFAVLALTGVAVGAGPPRPVPHPQRHRSPRRPGRWGAAAGRPPTSESDEPRARLYIIDRLDLGAVIHRRIEIVNTTAHPAQLTVYPDAAAITGGTFTAAPGHTPNELTEWISTDPAALTVPAASTAHHHHHHHHHHHRAPRRLPR